MITLFSFQRWKTESQKGGRFCGTPAACKCPRCMGRAPCVCSEAGLLVWQIPDSPFGVSIVALGAQGWPHLTFQKLYISWEIMRCGMEGDRIYMAVKCSLVSKIWLHYSLWHSKDHLCPLASGWISRYRPRLRKHCQIFLYSLISLLLSTACNALAFGKSGRINIFFFFKSVCPSCF